MNKIFLILFCLIAFHFSFVQVQDIPVEYFDFPIGFHSPFINLVDYEGGFAYITNFRYSSNPLIYKFNLSTFEIVGSIVLSRISISNGVIDTIHGFAYFMGIDYSPWKIKVVKIDLKTFSVNGSFLLSTDRNIISAQIDQENQIGYFVSDYPIYAFKVDLGNMVEEAKINLWNNAVMGSVLDLENGFFYASTDGIYGPAPRLFKIPTSSFDTYELLELDPETETNLNFGVIDYSTNLMYFGTDTNPMTIVKIDLDTYTKDSSVNVTGFFDVAGIGMDKANNLLYFVTQNPALVKMNLETLGVIDHLDLDTDSAYTASFNFTAQKVIIGLDYSELIEVDLVSFTQDNQIVEMDFANAEVILIDELNEIGYILFSSYYGLVGLVDLQTFKVVDHLFLDNCDDDIYIAQIDSKNGFAYFFFSDGFSIIKLNLQTWEQQKVDFFPDDSDDLYIYSSAFDVENQFLYAGFYNDSTETNFIFKISTNLEIVDNVQPVISDLDIWGVDYLTVDSSNGYLYGLLDVDDVGSGYFLQKYDPSSLGILGSTNLTDYDITTISFDHIHQYYYFGTGEPLMLDKEKSLPNAYTIPRDSEYPQICRVDVSSMELMNDCVEDNESYSLMASFIEPSYSYIFFFSIGLDEEWNPISTLVQVDTTTNQIGTINSLNISLYEFNSGYDPTTNYAYVFAEYSHPVPFYRFQLPETGPEVDLLNCSSLYSKFSCFWQQKENDTSLEFQIKYQDDWVVIENPSFIEGENVFYQEFESPTYPEIYGNVEYSIQIKACNLTTEKCGGASSSIDLTTRIDSLKNFDLIGLAESINASWNYPNVEIDEGIPQFAQYMVSYFKLSVPQIVFTHSIGDTSQTTTVLNLSFGFGYNVSMWACRTYSCQGYDKGEVVSAIAYTGFGKVSNLECDVSDSILINCSWDPPEFTQSSSTNQLFTVKIPNQNYQIFVSACISSGECGNISSISITTQNVPAPSNIQLISKIEEIGIIFSELSRVQAYLISVNNGTDWEDFTTIYSNEIEMIGTKSGLSGNYEYQVSIRGCTDSSCETQYLGLASSSIPIKPKLGNVTSFNCVADVCGANCSWDKLELSEGLEAYSLSYNSESICISKSLTNYPIPNLIGDLTYEISIFASADPDCKTNDYSGINSTTSIKTLPLPAPSIIDSISKIEEIELIFSIEHQELTKSYLISTNNGLSWGYFTSIELNGSQVIGTKSELPGNYEYEVLIRGCTDPSCGMDYLGLVSSSILIKPKLGNITSFNCVPIIYGFECSWDQLGLSLGLKGYSLSYNSESVCLSTKETNYSISNLTAGINYEISIFASADPNCESNDYSGINSTTSIQTLAPTENASDSIDKKVVTIAVVVPIGTIIIIAGIAFLIHGHHTKIKKIKIQNKKELGFDSGFEWAKVN
ncbi:tenascin [Anaeramoeba ignava]|uniref:Tenascin n=1 Tax=Anaeramoeba ignava TaxID=1746090 RepID=A0A9Q0LQ75_ANAIG|nr:tenascin [Anaeramoeba ignava]